MARRMVTRGAGNGEEGVEERDIWHQRHLDKSMAFPRGAYAAYMIGVVWWPSRIQAHLIVGVTNQHCHFSPLFPLGRSAALGDWQGILTAFLQQSHRQ